MFNYNNNPKYYQNYSSNINSDVFYTQGNLPTRTYNFSPLPNIYHVNQIPSSYYNVTIPMSLAKSLEGKYFLGYVDGLSFGAGTFSWARLYNPPDSGVNLHVNVWTISDVARSSYTATIWFNSTPPGAPIESESVTSSNTAINPIPHPKVKIQYAAASKGFPQGGTKAFIRRGQPESTIVSEEEGKFIFPPGGSFTVFLSNPQNPTIPVTASIAFGWWEENFYPLY